MDPEWKRPLGVALNSMIADCWVFEYTTSTEYAQKKQSLQTAASTINGSQNHAIVQNRPLVANRALVVANGYWSGTGHD